MSLWTSLEPASATVDAGGSTRVRLRLRNTGDIVDEYRFEPVGPVAVWTTVEPQTLRLFPGTTGTVELTFAPPRTSDATAGPNPYAVRVTPTEHPEATGVPEGNLTITPFTEVRAEIVPPTVRGRFRGRPRLAVDNLGNTKVTASFGGSDTGDHLAYDLHPGSVQIEPGRAAFVKTTLKPKKIIWFGPKEQRPYSLAVQRAGTAAVPVQGTFVQRGFLPRWLATFLGVLTALAVTFLMLWIAYKPQVNTAATERVAEVGSTLAPPSPVIPSAPLSPSTPPSAVQTQPQPQPQVQSSPGGGGTPAKKADPPVVPAAGILLRNSTTQRCVDIPNYGKGTVSGPVGQYTCDGTSADNQLFDLKVVRPDGAPGGLPLFVIRNVKDQLCVDVSWEAAQPVGTPIAEFDCAGTTNDNQLWWVEKQDTGYWIRNFGRDQLCLDEPGWNSGKDSQLALGKCSNYQAQEWQIIHPATTG